MNFLNFLLLSVPLIGWLGFQVIPPGDRLLLIAYGITASVFLCLVYGRRQGLPDAKDLRNSTRAVALAIPLLLVLTYGLAHRWKLEPHGMIDATVLWNAKASYITNRFLAGEPTTLTDPLWKHNSYPPGLPVSLAFVASVLGGWELAVPYGLVLVMNALLALNLLRYAISSNANGKVALFLSFGIISYSLLGATIIQSDLCADFPMYFGISLFGLIFFNEESTPGEVIALAVSWIASMKNEGLVVLPFLMLLLLYRALRDRRFIRGGLSVFLLILVFALLPLVAHKAEAGLLHSDFQTTGSLLIDKLTEPARYLSIAQFILLYNLSFLSGIPILATTILVVFDADQKRRVWVFAYWLLHLIYSSLYLFTDLDLAFHLQTSYLRIQMHLLPMIIIAMMDYVLRSRSLGQLLVSLRAGRFRPS